DAHADPAGVEAHLGQDHRAGRVTPQRLGAVRHEPPQDLIGGPPHGGDGRDPQPLVDLGPAGVVDTGDHVVDAEHLPRHPRGDDVGVVAAADGDEGGGRLDARLDENVAVEPYAGDPASLEARAEPAKGLWAPVDAGDRTPFDVGTV